MSQNLFSGVSRFAALCVLGIMSVGVLLLMLSVAFQESAIMDELAHIPAGYGYVRYLDFRLNPEHPPLVKALDTLPLLFGGFSFPTENNAWTSDINAQWAMGDLFIYHSNPGRADEIIFWSRIPSIILTLILLVFVYIWARALMGSWWALAPAFLTAFSPHILAHGHYVTTDIGATLGFFIGLYFFVRFLENQTPTRLVWAGVFFGIAQLMKFSVVLLIPLCVFLALVHWLVRVRERGIRFFSWHILKSLWKYVRSLLLIFVIGFVVVWAVYALLTLNYPAERQRSDTEFTLNSFAKGPQPLSVACNPTSFSPRCLAEINVWMADKPIVRGLGQYMLGVLMVLQRSAGGNTAYFLGNIGAGGWWYYFPVVFLLKESLPALLIAGGGFLLALWRLFRNPMRRSLSERLSGYAAINFSELAMVSLIVLYWTYSIKSPLNIGFRHILPTIPFMYILAIGSVRRWIVDQARERSVSLTGFSRALRVLTAQSVKSVVLLFLGVWVLVETLLAYPYFLSYFNELGGGVWGGYRYVTDSNYDWGQDLKRLRNYVEKNGIEKIAVDYFGGGDVEYYLGSRAAIWWPKKNKNPLDEGIEWLAVSANVIQSAKATAEPGFEKSSDEYQWLTHADAPYARAGTSIFIYRLR